MKRVVGLSHQLNGWMCDERDNWENMRRRVKPTSHLASYLATQNETLTWDDRRWRTNTMADQSHGE